MADITPTPSAVAPIVGNTQIASGTAGATINAGQSVYVDPADNKVKLAANTNATTAAAVGLAVNSAASNQPIEYATGNDLTVNSVLTAGAVYVLGNAAGTISASADLDASINTRYGTILGIATSATNLRLGPLASGVLNP